MRFSRRERRAYLDRYVRSESRGRGTENQPTGHGPKGWLEKGPSASLFVRYVSHRICSSLTPRIQTLLKPTVCLLLMTRCTSIHLPGLIVSIAANLDSFAAGFEQRPDRSFSCSAWPFFRRDAELSVLRPWSGARPKGGF